MRDVSEAEVAWGVSIRVGVGAGIEHGDEEEPAEETGKQARGREENWKGQPGVRRQGL